MNQSKTIETKVFGMDSRLTGGYREIPKVGDSLLQYINRERTSTHYLKSSLMWAKLDLDDLSAYSPADLQNCPFWFFRCDNLGIKKSLSGTH